MRDVTVRDLRNKGGEVLKKVEAGQSFIITRDGHPVAEIQPLRRRPLSREVVLERFARVPAIDGAKLRSDIDSVIDQTL